MSSVRKIAEPDVTPKRAHVTIPEDLESLFAWYVRYDARFERSPAAAAAYFFRQGLTAEYERGVREADPLDEATYRAMARSQARALRSALDE